MVCHRLEGGAGPEAATTANVGGFGAVGVGGGVGGTGATSGGGRGGAGVAAILSILVVRLDICCWSERRAVVNAAKLPSTVLVRLVIRVLTLSTCEAMTVTSEVDRSEIMISAYQCFCCRGLSAGMGS